MQDFSNTGLNKLDRIFRDKVAPKVVQSLMKYYGISVEVFKVKNKTVPLSNSPKSQSTFNMISREVYQNSSLLQEDDNKYEYGIIDENPEDYLNGLDSIGIKRVLITTIEFQQFNGIIAGSEQQYNMYCLDYIFNMNDIIEMKTIEGISKRYKISEIHSIGDTTNILKRYVIISIVV